MKLLRFDVFRFLIEIFKSIIRNRLKVILDDNYNNRLIILIPEMKGSKTDRFMNDERGS